MAASLAESTDFSDGPEMSTKSDESGSPTTDKAIHPSIAKRVQVIPFESKFYPAPHGEFHMDNSEPPHRNPLGLSDNSRTVMCKRYIRKDAD